MNAGKLNKIFTTASGTQISEFIETWDRYSFMFGLDTKQQEDFFLAQVLQEVGSDLISRRENLNYTPERLRNTFTFYRDNPNTSEQHGRNNEHSADQVKIGNHAYADRIGNGHIQSGDGYRFRGGGYFQLTGRANYDTISETLTLALGRVVTSEEIEDRLHETEMGLLTAMGFWFINGCFKVNTIDEVTRIVNRYTDTYDERKAHYERIASL